MSRLRVSLVLFLILGLSFVVADSEEDSDEKEVKNQETTSDEESDEEDVALTKSDCVNGLESREVTQLCCHYHLHLDKASAYCNENEDLSDLDFSTEGGKVQGVMRLVECFFRRKKYIKSKNVVNMKYVQADADKLHDPAKAEFMLKMYKTCEREGKATIRMYNQYPPEAKKYLRNSHQMFVHVVYACVNNYFKEKACPYFYWFSEGYGDNIKCLEYAERCKKLAA